MPRASVISESPDSAATEQLGARLAGTLGAGDIVLLSGDLGAGKTTLVRGAAVALGVVAAVTSPTFAIAHRYPVAPPGRAGVTAVAHLDLYRLAGLEDEDPDLLGDYVGPDTISFIEWPEGAEAVIAQFGRIRLRVSLSHAGGDRRIIEVTDA